MAIEFEIADERRDHDTRVVRVSGEIDLFTAPEFKQRVGAAIESGARRVVVDLSRTTFIDSSSLGVLIGAHRRAELSGGTLIVVCDQKAIVKTFRITGLDSLFTIVPSLDDVPDGDAVEA